MATPARIIGVTRESSRWIFPDEAMKQRESLMRGDSDLSKWQNADIVGNYYIRGENRCVTIYPRNKNDETFKVEIEKYAIILKHFETNLEVEFVVYSNRGKWLWKDSRVDKNVRMDEVIVSLMRMTHLNKIGVAKLLKKHLGLG